MNEHVTDQDIEQFAIGALADPAAFEAHVNGCDACAARLAREARFELALEEVRAVVPVRRRAVRAGVLVSLAAAAAVLFMVFRRNPEPDSLPSVPMRAIVCADGPDQAGCVEKAHRHGLFVHYPAWAGPPRFAAMDRTR